MTIINIISGFRTTGIYPFNRQVFSPPGDEMSLTKENGLAFIPLYSPASRRTTWLRGKDEAHCLQVELDCANDGPDLVEDELDFPEAEISKFEKRYAEGYDLTHDTRYNLWLSRFHPDSPVSQKVWLQPLQTTSVSKFLQYPSPPSKIPVFTPKPCGKVLTSTENLALIREKELAKEERKRAKEENKRAREAKKKAREEKIAMRSTKTHQGKMCPLICACRAIDNSGT